MVVLGEVELPSGVMMILDPGLGRFWRHEGEAKSPRAGDAPSVDMAVVGPDARAAGGAFDHSFVPERIYDVANVDKLAAKFAAHCKKHGFDARLEPLRDKVPHLERARIALAHGEGLGVVEFNRIWGVVVAGLPERRALTVSGDVMAGEFEGRYRTIDVVVDAGAAVARTQSVMGVMVEHGQLMCVGLEPLGQFKMWESLDGLADFVFWGVDAAALAAEFGAQPIGESQFGWRDVPMDKVGELAQPLQQRVAQKGLRVGVDYRPHDNLEKLNAQIRSTETRSGGLVLDGAKVVGCDNRWGDGIFSVARDFDGAGRVVRVRLDVGNAATQARTRRVMSCMVSKHLLDEDAMPKLAAREEPDGWYNGWIFFSGHAEESLPDFGDDPDNWRAMPMHELIRRFPIIDAIVDTAPECEFELDGNGSRFHRVDG